MQFTLDQVGLSTASAGLQTNGNPGGKGVRVRADELTATRVVTGCTSAR